MFLKGLPFPGLLAFLLAGIPGGVNAFPGPGAEAQAAPSPAIAPSAAGGVAAAATAAAPVEINGVHNAFRLGPGLYSGSAPEGDAAFAALARLGVRTVISVDGARPDVESARKHGIRYVHLPHGYDGIGTNTQCRLIQASRLQPGGVFVHCHHGKHRGPAAAAVLALANDGWTVAEADAYLHRAGTSTNYPGLYRAVQRFQIPNPETLKALPKDLPETATVPGLVEAMVGIDTRWEHLLAVRKAGYRVPAEHPDLDPAAEAVLLWEHFREAARTPEARQAGPDLVKALTSAEAEAQAVERLLREIRGTPGPDLTPRLDRAFDTVKESCSSCHRRHRDRPGGESGRWK